MKNETTFTCGIDVSKDTLDCCYNTADGREVHLQVSNDEKGFRELFKGCGTRKYAMETSGPVTFRVKIVTSERVFMSFYSGFEQPPVSPLLNSRIPLSPPL